MNVLQIAKQIQASHKKYDKTHLAALSTILVNQDAELAAQLADYITFALQDKAMCEAELRKRDMAAKNVSKKGLLTIFM
jgi:hypothetical protein